MSFICIGRHNTKILPKQCPASLVAPLVKIIIQETRKLCKKQPVRSGFNPIENAYEPLKLMQTVMAKTNEVCMRYLDNSKLCSLPTPGPPYNTVSVCAIKNTRRRMEDRHVVIHDLNSLFYDTEENPSSYYAIFDGHAGLHAAFYSSTHLHQFLAESDNFISDPEQALREAFFKTDSLFVDKCKTENLNSGTTAVCALHRHKEKTLYIAWVGDSQALLVDQGKIRQCVDPHKPSREDEKIRIEKEGGCVMYWGTWRVNGQLAVSRAIGDHDYKPYVTAIPDIIEITLKGTEDFLILACDGLWDFLSEADAANCVYSQLSSNSDDIEAISSSLVQLAKKQGSCDNISVIVVFLRETSKIAAEAHWATRNNLIMDTLDNANTTNPFANSNNAVDILGQKDNFVLNLGDSFKHNGTEKSTSNEFLCAKPTNGKRPAEFDDEDDLGPETDVDAVDDVLLSPTSNNFNDGNVNNNTNTIFDPFCSIKEEKATLEIDSELQKQVPSEFDLTSPREETPTPPVDTVHDGSALLENVAESGDDSDDEWNYFKGDNTTNENAKEKVTSTEVDLEISALTDSNLESDTMSQLNPDAQEFVPVSPSRPSISPSFQTLIEDSIISQSPRRPPPDVDINLPNIGEFASEIKTRASDLFASNGSDKSDSPQKLTSQEIMENLLNGKSIDEIEFQPNSTPIKVVKTDEFHFGPNATPFSTPGKLLDQSEAFSTKAVFGDDSTASYLDAKGFDVSVNSETSVTPPCAPLETDNPMSMSFYQNDENDETPFDLNRVQVLPENIEDYLGKTTENGEFNETISDLPEHHPLGNGISQHADDLLEVEIQNGVDAHSEFEEEVQVHATESPIPESDSPISALSPQIPTQSPIPPQSPILIADSPIPQDVIAKSPIPQDVIAESPIPQGVIAESPIPQDVIAESPIPQDLIDDSSIPQVIPDSPISENVIVESSIPQDVIAESTTSQDVIAESTTSQDVITESPIPQDVIAESPIPDILQSQIPASENSVSTPQSPIPLQSPVLDILPPQSSVLNTLSLQSSDLDLIPIQTSSVLDSQNPLEFEHHTDVTSSVPVKNIEAFEEGFVEVSKSPVFDSNLIDHLEPEANKHSQSPLVPVESPVPQEENVTNPFLLSQSLKEELESPVDDATSSVKDSPISSSPVLEKTLADLEQKIDEGQNDVCVLNFAHEISNAHVETINPEQYEVVADKEEINDEKESVNTDPFSTKIVEAEIEKKLEVLDQAIEPITGFSATAIPDNDKVDDICQKVTETLTRVAESDDLIPLNPPYNIEVKSELIEPEYPVESVAATPSEESKLEDTVRSLPEVEQNISQVIEQIAIPPVVAQSPVTEAEKKPSVAAKTRTTAIKKTSATAPKTTSLQAKSAVSKTTTGAPTKPPTKSRVTSKVLGAASTLNKSSTTASKPPLTKTKAAPTATKKPVEEVIKGPIRKPLSLSATSNPLTRTVPTTAKASPNKPPGDVKAPLASARTTTSTLSKTSSARPASTLSARPTTLTSRVGATKTTTTSTVTANKTTAKPSTTLSSPKVSNTAAPKLNLSASARSKPLTSKPLAKPAEVTKQIKDTTNKQITAASRTTTKTTTTRTVPGKTNLGGSTTRKVESKVPPSLTITKTMSSTTKTSTNAKKPVESINKSKQSISKSNGDPIIKKLKEKTENNECDNSQLEENNAIIPTTD